MTLGTEKSYKPRPHEINCICLPMPIKQQAFAKQFFLEKSKSTFYADS